jgi:hypothetical protein
VLGVHEDLNWRWANLVRWRKERFGLLVSESGLKGAYPRFFCFFFCGGKRCSRVLTCLQALSREKSGSVEIGRRWRRRKKKRWTSAKLPDEIQGYSYRLRRRTFGTPYALLIFSLSHACQCGSLCLEHLQLRLLCSLVVIVIDVYAISVTVTCFETLCERETPRVPKHYAKCTHVRCSLLMIGLTSDQTESIEALGKHIWEEKLRVLELAITLHLAKSFFFPSLHLHFWEENGQFWMWRQVLYQHLRKLARHATCIWPGFISLFCTMYWMQMVCKQLLSSQGFCNTTPLFVITLLCFSAQLCLLQQI